MIAVHLCLFTSCYTSSDNWLLLHLQNALHKGNACHLDSAVYTHKTLNLRQYFPFKIWDKCIVTRSVKLWWHFTFIGFGSQAFLSLLSSLCITYYFSHMRGVGRENKINSDRCNVPLIDLLVIWKGWDSFSHSVLKYHHGSHAQWRSWGGGGERKVSFLFSLFYSTPPVA